ncbi:hypothetical protein, partial [Paenibacillus allorhizoplanae]|uniref:hypothetical protein n=1 Tax=Paenibacillus allorhizoplanae TaxID=2905648 RepID=UPI001F1AED64
PKQKQTPTPSQSMQDWWLVYRGNILWEMQKGNLSSLCILQISKCVQKDNLSFEFQVNII